MPETAKKWLEPLAADLLAHKGKCAVIAGESQPAAVHALAHAINAALGNVGQTVLYTKPVEAKSVDQTAELAALVKDMADGKVGTLVVAGVNPVYDAPADLDFAKALDRVKQRIHIGSARTRRRRCATGTCPRPTSSRRGATPARSTAPRPSCNR